MVLLAVVGVLYAVFQRTKIGLAMRAVSMNPDSSRLVGISVGRTLMIGWGIAALVGALAGALIAPRLFLDVNFMGGVLIYSFAAATLGGFDSPFGAVLGGWIIGDRREPRRHLRGLHRRRPEDPRAAGGDPRRAAVPAHRPVRLGRGGAGMSAQRIRLAAWGVVLVLAVLLPFFFNAYRVGQFTQAAALAVAVLGLNLLVGYSGQISLGHGAFFALGAYTSAISIDDLGVPYLLTLPLAGAVCALAGSCSACPRCGCAGSTSRSSRSGWRSPPRRSSSARPGSRAARRASASTRSRRRRGRASPTTSGCTSSRSS